MTDDGLLLLLLTSRFSRETNGKIERFFDIFEKKVRFFSSIDEFMKWYNEVRPHGAFDLSKLETPVQMFSRENLRRWT